MKLTVFFVLFVSFFAKAQTHLSWREDTNHHKIQLLLNGRELTSYCYFDSTEKPVLYPIRTVNGVTVTRGYPVAPREGERADHPHHTGLWLNYESVNGIDYWNNSFAISTDQKHRYGSIRHVSILEKSSGKGRASLKTSSQWVNAKGDRVIDEVTSFTFTISGSSLIIDRQSKLTAVADSVLFKDVKDGLLGLRLARPLEMPSQQKDHFIEGNGKVSDIASENSQGVTGMYTNREGITGDATWGKRSVWTQLTGRIGAKDIGIVMIDRPKNPGYPTYWHARGYGLFAANPLGQAIFSNGKETLNLRLEKGSSVNFTYRIIVHEGLLDRSQVETWMQDFHRLNYE